jgi:DNA repair photolyase
VDSTHILYDYILPLWVEISLAFWNEQSRKLFEPGAPSVANRLEAVAKLQHVGVPVALRIDPLFSRDPLGNGKAMRDFDLFDIQSQDDLWQLVSFCTREGIRKIIYSPLKITKPRSGSLPSLMNKIKRVYEHLSAGKPLEFRGGSWRLPQDIVQHVLFAPLLELCQEAGIEARGCKENLLGHSKMV